MTNYRLREAIQATGLTLESVAAQLDVDPKTVERWITQNRVPYPRHRVRLARSLETPEEYLWPDVTLDHEQVVEDETEEAMATELVNVYPHRSSVPTELWRRLLCRATERIAILVYAGQFLYEQQPRLVEVLRTKAEEGTDVRLLLGDPDGPAALARDAETGGADRLVAKMRHVQDHYRLLADHRRIAVRLHRAMLYSSIYRFGNEMLVHSHLHGVPPAHAPVVHLHYVPTAICSRSTSAASSTSGRTPSRPRALSDTVSGPTQAATNVGAMAQPRPEPAHDGQPVSRQADQADQADHAGNSADQPDGALAVRHEGGVLWLTLNRPEAGNAMTPDQRDRLIDLLADASGRADVRVVVLGATGRHFCTGADLRGAGAGAGAAGAEGAEGAGRAAERVPGEVARMIRTGAQRLMAAVLDCEKPVIAAVNGTAAGLGAHLALACDLVIASESARFIEVFVRRGLVPDAGGAWLLPRLVGIQRAKELMFLGDDVPATRAEQLGLVNRVVAADALHTAVAEWAERLARGPTVSIGLAKRLVNRSLDVDRVTAFDDEAVAQELNMGTHDAGEGVRSFVEHRDPDFRGW